MVYHGYLAIGGNEILNTARAVGVSRSLGVYELFPEPRRARVEEALHDSVPYSVTNIVDAPWFDSGAAEESEQFLGFAGLAIKQVNDVDRQLQITEGLRDGAVLGRSRVGPQRVRVEGYALATSAAGMDHGLAWLRGALAPTVCGQHGASCGQTDAEFFVDAPPSRPSWESWDVTATNLVYSPDLSEATVTGTGFSHEPIPGGGLGLTRTGVGATQIVVDLATTGGAYVVMVEARAYHPVTREAFDFSVSLDGGPAQHVALPDALAVTAGDGFTTSVVTLSTGGGAGEVVLSLDEAGLADVGHVLEIQRVGVFEAPYDGALFDATTTDTVDIRYSLEDGLAVQEARTVTPYSDEEYEELTLGVRRFLHDVAVESGPLVTEEFVDEVTDVHGYRVEFDVVASRAGLFGATVRKDLQATDSVIVSDVRYNLMPTPRPGLDLPPFSDTEVRAANYMTNPSVEIGTAGISWTDEAITGAAPSLNSLVTLARSDDLAAVGAYSARLRLLGSPSVTQARSTSILKLWQQSGTVQSGHRLGASVWAGAVISAGTEVSAVNSITAIFELMNGSTVIETLGTVTVTDADLVSGHVFESPLVTTDATRSIRVRVEAEIEWTSGATNSDIRLYADAWSVTNR